MHVGPKSLFNDIANNLIFVETEAGLNDKVKNDQYLDRLFKVLVNSETPNVILRSEIKKGNYRGYTLLQCFLMYIEE